MLHRFSVAAIIIFSVVFALASLGQSYLPRLSENTLAAQEGIGKSGELKMKMAQGQAATQPTDPAPFALIELFTSEGCSSCPSADTNLEQIAAAAATSGQNIYTLSYHVDYWNYLGWKDPYSSKAFSDRQRRYAQQFRSKRVYTPQMVVNGKAEFVGSNRKYSTRAVQTALRSTPETSIAVTATITGKQIEVDWQAKGIERGNVVQVALVQNEGAQKVNRGENARRKLTHVNIVRHLETVSRPGNMGKVELAIPNGLTKDDLHIVAFVQTPTGISAANKSTINEKNLTPATRDRRMEQDVMTDGVSKMPRDEITTVAFRKPAAFSLASSSQRDVKQTLVDGDTFFQMLSLDMRGLRTSLAQVERNWDISYVPMLLEVGRFMQSSKRAVVMDLVERKTGQKFGSDFDQWMQWSWKQEYQQHPQYTDFKTKLYRRLDLRFGEYFEETENAKIRLDEIRWGGVRRDGIPPLKDPEMVTADQASYLADSDIVFGIKLNGDARAYPKRILAWHEMFKDTIGGESVCGVY